MSNNLEAIERLKARADPPECHTSGDSEMAAMLAEVDLLALIQADTGEQGRKSADRIDFKSCPICGHLNCFSYYPTTNSWSCYSKSNTSGYAGGTAIEFYKATRTDDDTEAVKWLRETTGRPYQGNATAVKEESAADADRWRIVDTDLDNMPTLAPELIEGLLRVGRKGIIAGASKSHKSWLALNLAISVATGGTWLDFKCRKGRVLYLNMEIAADSFPHRIEAVTKAKGVDGADLANLKRIDMRGFYEGADRLKSVILSQAKRGDYDLILLDPLYKIGLNDENSASEVAAVCKTIDQICESIGCAFIYVHHHSKGHKGDVASIDRASGSGVFARDPDMICDVTRILPADEADNMLDEGQLICPLTFNMLDEGQRAYQLTFDLREFISPPPLNVIYRDRLHFVDTEGITAEWKPQSAAGRKRGGKTTAELNKARSDLKSAQIIAALAANYYSQGVTADGLLLKEAAELCGCDSRALTKAIESTDLFELVQVSQRKRFVVAKNPPPEQPPTLDLEAAKE